MIRLSTVAWVAIAGVTCTALFNISYDVRRLDRQLNRLNTAITQEQDSIRVLRAEWWYLNQTSRLEGLARSLTSLTPQRPDRILADFSQLPLRPDIPPGRVMVALDGVRGLEAVALPPLRPGSRPVDGTVHAASRPAAAPAAPAATTATAGATPPAPAQPPAQPEAPRAAPPPELPPAPSHTVVATAPAPSPAPAATEVASAPVGPPLSLSPQPPALLAPAATDGVATASAPGDPIAALIRATGPGQEVSVGPGLGGLGR